MTNHSSQETGTVVNTANLQQANLPRLSDDAFYLLALASKLKEMLGPVSLQHFLAMGERVSIAKNAS